MSTPVTMSGNNGTMNDFYIIMLILNECACLHIANRYTVIVQPPMPDWRLLIRVSVHDKTFDCGINSSYNDLYSIP